MNDLTFEGIVSDVKRDEYENRYHEADERVCFIVTEDEGLHQFRQSHYFEMYGSYAKRYGDRVEEGARVRVSFAFNGTNVSQAGRIFNREGVWCVERMDN